MKRGRSSSFDQRSSKRRKTGGQSNVERIIARQYQYAPRALEYKVTDVGATGTVSTGGTIVPLLNNLVRGTDYINNFLGNKVQPVGLQGRFTCITGDVTNAMRVLIFQWMDSSTPTVSGVLQSPANCLSPVLVTNRSQINVLYDRLYTGSDYGSTGGQYFLAVPAKPLYIKGRNMFPIEFATGTADVQKGELFCLLISDSSAVIHPSVSYYFRMTFTD